jgi:hypothetical protein
MQKIIVTFILIMATASASAQKLWQKQGHALSCPVCVASEKTEKFFIPPPGESLNLLKSAEKKSEIIVSYSLFPNEAREAFEYAKGIWETLIESPVPIYIQANWRPKGQNVLGSCGPASFEKNFRGAPRKDVYYPIALAEKISETELTGSGQPDILAEFNKDIDWYFGTDGNTPARLYDFVSVVLHEIGHGLGFTGFFYVEGIVGGNGFYNYGNPTSFDLLVEKLNGDQLTNTSVYTNPSADLRKALVSGSLVANSPVAVADGGRSMPRLYAPYTWDDGSSIYHLNDFTYPGNDPNSLMTHALGRGSAIHDPGPLTMGIMADMGWKNLQIDFSPPKDMEETGVVSFQVKITSDYPLDTTKIYLILTSDSFDAHRDTIPLKQDGQGFFKTRWQPDPETEAIRYYISAGDVKNRIFNLPTEAPSEFFTVNFGTDSIMPSITHEPIVYFFDTGKGLKIFADVDDNLGLDTVFVEYSINGVKQPPFGLVNDSATAYSAFFPIENNSLQDGDEINYNLVAIDASNGKNQRKLPMQNSFSFRTEKMLDPVAGYINNFDNPTTDFILNDFDVFTEENFDNGALHSPHPYPSPEQDNTEFNFSAMLKYPVILNDNAFMTFDEIVLVEPGDPGTQFGDFGFWDYVIAEGSNDKGDTWLPLTDGYDSRKARSWEDHFNSSIKGVNSTTRGTPEMYINRRIDLLDNDYFSKGDTILVRFRLFSDPYAYGWGWAIDNLRIQTPVSVIQPLLSPGNILAWPNPFSGKINVSVESAKVIEVLQLEVYNVYGQKLKSVVHQNVTGKFVADLEIENSQAGMYLLVVKENGKQVFTKKLIHN